MTLKSRIIITIAVLIILSTLIFIYLASQIISQSSIAHAYRILSINNSELINSTQNSIQLIKRNTVSITYNTIKKFNQPQLAKYFKITILDDKKEIIYGKNDLIKICNLKNQNLQNTTFSISNAQTICMIDLIKIEDKYYTSIIELPKNLFSIKEKDLTTIIIAPGEFEINLTKNKISSFSNEKYQEYVKSGIFSDSINFFKTKDDVHFVLTQKIPNTNLSIISYIEEKQASSYYQNFLYYYFSIIAIILLSSIFILIIIVNSFLKPIRNLCIASKKLADGEEQVPLENTKFKEINELICSYNIMMEKIKSRENELSELNKNLAEEVKQKTKELIHTAKIASLGTLSSGIAHEFNNILGAIIGHVSLALEDKNPTKMESALEIALNASEKACKIVSRLQDFSKKKEYNYQKHSLNKSIYEVLKLIKKDFLNFKIEILTELEKDIYIKCDSTQIEQVILNLLINSKHAMTTGGKILIKTKSQKNKVELYISDTGSGISNYIQDRIFEPFFTTKGVVGMGKDFGSQDLEGTGLGLSVSLGIIEAHGGKIKLLKSSKKGTTFKITLPIAIDTDKER